MTSQRAGVLAEPPPTKTPSDDWVLPFSLNEPGRELPGGVRWAEWGPFRCFFHGLLCDRDHLAHSSGCSEPDCSDADLVLRAYERGGEAVLSRLRGSFVVTIVDRARDRVIVARDALGTHPLFYVEAGSRVLFAAAPQPLLNYPGVPRSLNRVALADHLCNRWPDPHETFFVAVRRVLPGWRAVISGGNLRVGRYWDPMPEDQPSQWLAKEEAARFDEVLNRAVQRCLQNGPTAIYLSGGLDSISIAAVAADLAPRIGQPRPWALSLGFPDPACDERDRQTGVALGLGLRQYLIGFHEALGSRPLFEQSLELSQTLAAPIQNIWQVAYLALARHARYEGVQNILSGHGGDEWLCVTPLLAADLIMRGALVELARFFLTLQRSSSLPILALARTVLWRCGVRPLACLALHRFMPDAVDARRPNRVLSGDPLWVAPDRELRAEQRRRIEGALTCLDPPNGFYRRELRTCLDHAIISWDLEERYELGRRIGVHFLHPYWDPDVVEMLCRTPPHILLEGGRTKGVVRRTLARRFPTLELERQRKVSATSFYRSLLLREGQALADAAGDFPSLSGLGIVDGKMTRDIVRRDLQQPGHQIHFAWEVVNLETWSRLHHG